MAEHRIKSEVNQFLCQSHEGISLTVTRPRQAMPVGRFTSDEGKLRFCIDTGYRDGLELVHNGQIRY